MASTPDPPTARTFDVVVTRDPHGWLVASVPALPGCHTQAKSRTTLRARIKDAIALCLDDPVPFECAFLGTEQVRVEVPGKR